MAQSQTKISVAHRPGRAPRPEEQTRRRILEVAAEWFADHGYAATSVRDIAREVDVAVGAIYVHFPSKGQLLLSVYEEGVRRIGAAVDGALATARPPWDQLTAAAEAHLETLLGRAGFARVIVRVTPDDVPEVARGLKRLRDGYEARFEALVAELDLAQGVDRRLLRLMLLGALNATQTWHRYGAGRAEPSAIARQHIATLRAGAAKGKSQ
jgi:TetR/AcrR family transcriptional regulator, cholesterol catabolism regulator